MDAFPHIPPQLENFFYVHRHALRTQSPTAPADASWEQRQAIHEAWDAWWDALRQPTSTAQAQKLEGVRARLNAALAGHPLHRTWGEGSEAEWKDPFVLAFVRANDGDGVHETWKAPLHRRLVRLAVDHPTAPALVLRRGHGAEVPVAIETLTFAFSTWPQSPKIHWSGPGEAAGRAAAHQILDFTLPKLKDKWDKHADLIAMLSDWGAVPSQRVLDLLQKANLPQATATLQRWREARLNADLPSAPSARPSPRL